MKSFSQRYEPMWKLSVPEVLHQLSSRSVFAKIPGQMLLNILRAIVQRHAVALLPFIFVKELRCMS